MQYIQLKDGSYLEAPDDAADSDIKAKIEKIQGGGREKGWKSVLKDALGGLSDVPKALLNAAQDIPEGAAGAATQLATNPARLATNLATGFNQGARGAINTPAIIANYLKDKGIMGGEKWGMPAGEGNTEAENAALAMTKQQNPLYNQKADEFTQGLGAFAPYMAVPGAEAAGVRGLLARSGLAGAQAIGQKQNPLTASLMGLAAEGIPKGAQAAYEKARPSNLLRGKLPLEELKERLRVSQGTNIPLGNIVDSPFLKSTFAHTTDVPFAGGEGILENIQNQIGKKGEQVLEGTRPSPTQPEYLANTLIDKITAPAKQESERIKAEKESKIAGYKEDVNKTIKSLVPEELNKDPNEVINESVLGSKSNQQKVNRELYKNRENIADREGFEITGSPKLEKSNIDDSVLKNLDPEQRKTLSYLADIKGSRSKQKSFAPYFTPDKPPSLSQAQSLSSYLYDIGNDYSKSLDKNDQKVGRKYIGLSRDLKEDINNHIQEKGSSELKAAHNVAEEQYKNYYVPFLDKDLNKVIGKDKNPQSLVRKIIGAKSADEFTTIKKVTDLLPDEQKNLPGFTYLKKALDENGNYDTKIVSSLMNQLGDRQAKLLFPDKSVREKLRNTHGNIEEVSKLPENEMEEAANQNPLYKMAKKYQEKTPEGLSNEIISPDRLNDKVANIQSAKELLPDEQKMLLGNMYLRNVFDENGKIHTAKLTSLVKALGDNQFKELFPDQKIAQSLIDFSKLHDLGTEKASSKHFKTVMGGILGSSITGGLFSGHPLIGGAIAAGAPLLSKGINKALTSPSVRENLINKMIENAKKNKISHPLSSLVPQALVGTQQRNKDNDSRR